jgi:trimethylamine monooxygenase
MVRNVVYDEAKGHFVVTVCDVASQASRDEIFDYVICCSGHFSTPNVPTFPGLDSFTGRVLHAHDFRSAEEFTGKDILIVGTSYSAEDIGSQCYKYGVKSVTCSWRTRPMSFHFPDNFHTRPLLQRVDGRTCYFRDGSTADVDAIILCTGYVHHFPFVEDKLRLRTANRLCPDLLHEAVVWPKNPRMMYNGMQDQWFTFNMFDAQAWYARDVIMGRIPVPDVATMAAEHAKWRAKEDALEATDEALIRYQADYVRRLVSMTDYGMFDIDGVVSVFLDWEHHKHEDIMTFRDRAHRSVKTGTMSPVHHTTWLEERNDGIENYVTANRPQSKL